ncbi:MAG: hypothetical protein JSR91_00275 [Proteobacteria bacterium]|nr:hypothetical protein [Pseudomonadota bacterium]
MQLDKLDYTLLESLLRRVIREELEAWERRKEKNDLARYFQSITRSGVK